MNRKRVILFVVRVILALVVLGGLGAGWFWGLPWVAQERLDVAHPVFDVLYIERNFDTGSLDVIVQIVNLNMDGDDFIDFLTGLHAWAKWMQVPGVIDEQLTVFTVEFAGQHLVWMAFRCPMDKADWSTADGCKPIPVTGWPVPDILIRWPG